MHSESTRYEFLELLGRGGMGEVYRGRVMGSHGFEKPVAIKRLREELAQNEWFIDRLVQEAKLLVTLQHSNLVSVLDLGRRDDDVFIALEYVDGPDLGTLLRAGQLPLGVVTYIIRSACEGVAFAHQHRRGAVIHADLSPANILLSRAGEVKVTDFGIARRAGGGERRGIEGKYPYMSPEQARGEELSPQSDIFSMGVVLYEIMTGEQPFGGDDRDTIREAILHSTPGSPRALRPEIPEALEQACMTALAKQPERRFEKIRALAAAIKDIEFEEQWRDGAAELATLMERRLPMRSTASMRAVLADLGIGGLEPNPRRTAGATAVTTATAPAQRKTLELTGTVIVRAHGDNGGLTRWDRTSQPPRAFPWRTVAAIAIALGVALAGYGWLDEGDDTATAAGPAPNRAPPSPPDAAPRPEPPVDAAPRPDATRTAQPPAERKPKRRVGTLRIHSDPWAYVYIDGRKTGETTPSTHRLTAGRYKVRLHSPRTGLSRTLTVKIRAGKTKTLSVRLDEQ